MLFAAAVIVCALSVSGESKRSVSCLSMNAEEYYSTDYYPVSDHIILPTLHRAG